MVHVDDHRIADGVLLYRAPLTVAIPRGTCVPPRCDLIKQGELSALIKVLHVFFGVEPNPEITFTETYAYIPLPTLLLAPPYDAVDKFLDDVADHNRWMGDWQTAADRTPDTSPLWARRRGLSPDVVAVMVCQIANSIAKANTQEVRLTALSGRSETLRIPPRASLIAPSPSTSCGKWKLRIKRKEEYMQAEGITGQRVLVSRDAPGVASSVHGRLIIDLGRTRKTELMVATDIDLLEEKIE